ncbi:MAG: peptide chain release factor H [Pseudomonadota bacterium]
MTTLLVTAGDGPAECRQAVAHILNRMEQEAEGLALTIDRTNARHGPQSAVVLIDGESAEDFAQTWIGTIQWRMQSQLRKNHKRANWFVGVFRLDTPTDGPTTIHAQDVTFSTLRSGGPGGQHQNTTDSAVRAVHGPTGLTVVVREARSQHRNKALALTRLQALADARTMAAADRDKASRNHLHRQLERGNPIRRFEGPRFTEVRQ